MTELEKMVSGEYYDPLDSELIETRHFCKSCLLDFNTLNYTRSKDKMKILEKLFERTGKNLYIEDGFKCEYGFNITIGDNFFANFNCTFLDEGKITIGDNVYMSSNVILNTLSFPKNFELRTSGTQLAKPISIGSDCRIGAGVIFNPGAKIGNNVVVEAGSVVTKEFGNDLYLSGNPAKVVKYLE